MAGAWGGGHKAKGEGYECRPTMAQHMTAAVSSPPIHQGLIHSLPLYSSTCPLPPLGPAAACVCLPPPPPAPPNQLLLLLLLL